MPITKNEDKAEQAGMVEDVHHSKDNEQEKSHSEPHAGKIETQQAPKKYELDERPWPVC
jgi:hypothetical protein